VAEGGHEELLADEPEYREVVIRTLEESHV